MARVYLNPSYLFRSKIVRYIGADMHNIDSIWRTTTDKPIKNISKPLFLLDNK